MLLLLFHDKGSLVEIAGLKVAIEDCYGPYGLLAQDGGYLFVPIRESRLNAARLLKHLGRIVGISATDDVSHTASVSVAAGVSPTAGRNAVAGDSASVNASIKAALWLVDRELFYPDIGAVFGCSADRVAILSAANMKKNLLAKVALHEVGHLMGLDHCQKRCIMRLSGTRAEAEEKPSCLCADCSAQLMATLGDSDKACMEGAITPQSPHCLQP